MTTVQTLYKVSMSGLSSGVTSTRTNYWPLIEHEDNQKNMPKIHLQSNNTTAVCNWPWNNEAINFEIIEKFEMKRWLTKNSTKVTCKKCIKQFEKTNSLKHIEKNTSGWIIKIERKIPKIKDINKWYIISFGKNEKIKGGTSEDMAKIYKSENFVKKAVKKIEDAGYFKVEIIKK